VRHDLPAALAAAGDTAEIFICGGSEVYREALPLARRIYLTLVHRMVEGDIFFPELPQDFREVDRKSVRREGPVEFLVLERQASCQSAPVKEGA
jgi:dihydrofolate reductase